MALEITIYDIFTKNLERRTVCNHVVLVKKLKMNYGMP